MGRTKLANEASQIPERTVLPFFGHALSIPSGGRLMDYLLAEAEALGPIFRLRVFENEMVMVSGSDLVAELSDTDRFVKSVHADLVTLRDIGGDGLFTAYNEEPNWRKAHNILMPAFTREAMRGYHAMMVSAARSLISYWEQMGRKELPVDVSRDMTRLTFDTIGMCGFGHDFGSFAAEELHPFVASMIGALTYAQQANELPKIAKRLRFRRRQAYARDIMAMQDLITSLIERRRAEEPNRTDDLLGRMLNTPDPATGEPLDDANIRNQVMTFLIAGHETTGAALSFSLYYLAKHPTVLARAQREVDSLWGADDDISPSYEDVGKLTYVRQILEEALRLWPTAPGYAVTPVEETIVGGRYAFSPGECIQILIPSLHRQPEWGANVHSFDPDRFSAEASAARPGHVYKPFGNGERACIGRQFALHEATLVLGMLIHRFTINDRTNYQLTIGVTLTIKPDGFMLRPEPRKPADRLAKQALTAPASPRLPTRAANAAGNFASFAVFHGSNLGTSAGVARELAASAADRGFGTSVAPLNDATEKIVEMSPNALLLIVASSYNGRPTDDADRFLSWTETLHPGSLSSVTYAVLGVGDRTYAATYQRIPSLIDERLAAAGATRLVERGAVDVGGNFVGGVEDWSQGLWDAVGSRGVAAAALQGEPSRNEPPHLTLEPVASREAERARRRGMLAMTVTDAGEMADLAHPLGRSKRFLRLNLPEGVTYRTGDHLAVLPSNPDELVDRVGDRFGLELDRPVRVRATGRLRMLLPEDRPITLREILADYVELQEPASPDDLRLLAEHCPCPPERAPLMALAEQPVAAFKQSVTAAGISVLDLLERYRSINLPFETFLARLPAISPRRYSISSSNVVSPAAVDLMVSLVDAPHRDAASPEGRRYRGVASNYVASLRVGDTVLAKVVPCSDAFRLPIDRSAILIGAGTGLAPLRGMIGDRAGQSQAAPLITYFGCDHPDVDYLHRQELEAAERQGTVELRPTYAFAPVDGHKFVQDRMIAERAELWSLIEQGASVRVCGDAARLGAGVEAALIEIHKQCSGEPEAAADGGARQWLDSLRADGRYVSDVW
ncbi:cytochrome P450 [Mesorhizobium sp. CU2]|uniref:cytochrome P450 n=1 Tax=unclassified Mesorhizobium TaxID=325217 RepID=UPI00112D4275|nr:MULTISPECIES: cytochrome P450 [unclassified Mesorhizobium]TPN81098.1 cytochrome P450 [Mesorhizobium sp. CU3]TPO11681.1 cytochrome P450 [Mesorhizobium sp. CU2]